MPIELTDEDRQAGQEALRRIDADRQRLIEESQYGDYTPAKPAGFGNTQEVPGGIPGLPSAAPPDAGGGSFAPYQSQPSPQAYQQVGMGSSPYGGAYTPQYRPVQQPPPSIGGLELHPSEVPLAQIHQQLAQASLSPADQLELERAQNALAGVRQQLASGEITPQDSFVMNQMIHDNAGNLMVRASMLPILQHRLQMQLLQHQAAMQASIAAEHDRFNVATAQGRLPFTTVNGPDGPRLYVQTRPGHWEAAHDPHGGQNADRQRQQYQARLLAATQHWEGVLRRELAPAVTGGQPRRPDWWGAAGPVDPGEAGTQREIHRHALLMATHALTSTGFTPPQADTTNGAPRSNNPIALPTVPSDAPEEVRRYHSLAQQRDQAIRTAANLTPTERQSVMAMNAEAAQIFARHHGRMQDASPEVRRRYQELMDGVTHAVRPPSERPPGPSPFLPDRMDNPSPVIDAARGLNIQRTGPQIRLGTGG